MLIPQPTASARAGATIAHAVTVSTRSMLALAIAPDRSGATGPAASVPPDDAAVRGRMSVVNEQVVPAR